MFRATRTLRAYTLFASVMSGLLLWGATAKAEIYLLKKDKPEDWEVSINGRVNAYLSWVHGETVNTGNSGNLTGAGAIDRYVLVGPQIGIRGNPTPTSGTASPVDDKDVSTPRIRGGFASTILAFNIYKQVLPNVKLSVKLAFWAGIQNSLNPNKNNVREFNDSVAVDFREQYMQLEGTWGSTWGGRRIGLFNRGGMRMNWFLIHQHGVGHPCDVDSGGAATCGHTGTGSMFPARHAQLGYATPELAGFQLSVAALDAAMIDTSWNRTPTPRFEAELTYKKTFGEGNELNAWANGLTQQIGRVTEVAPQPGVDGISADAVLNVYGFGGGAWGRFSGFGLGATGWAGDGLGTAWALGNTAVDNIGKLRKHFGYLAAVNYKLGNFEIAASYGGVHVQATDWDNDPNNPQKVSVIKQIRGIGGKLAYHMTPVVFSIDGMNLAYKWHRNETQAANVISAGMLAEW